MQFKYQEWIFYRTIYKLSYSHPKIIRWVRKKNAVQGIFPDSPTITEQQAVIVDSDANLKAKNSILN